MAHRGPLHGRTLLGVPLPQPVFALSLRPAKTAQAKALAEALAVMSRDDPRCEVGGRKWEVGGRGAQMRTLPHAYISKCRARRANLSNYRYESNEGPDAAHFFDG